VPGRSGSSPETNAGQRPPRWQAFPPPRWPGFGPPYRPPARRPLAEASLVHLHGAIGPGQFHQDPPLHLAPGSLPPDLPVAPPGSGRSRCRLHSDGAHTYGGRGGMGVVGTAPAAPAQSDAPVHRTPAMVRRTKTASATTACELLSPSHSSSTNRLVHRSGGQSGGQACGPKPQSVGADRLFLDSGAPRCSFGMTLGDRGGNAVLVVPAVSGERSHGCRHLVEQGADLGAVIDVVGAPCCIGRPPGWLRIG
jgi:hypothetical protein